MPAIAQKKRNLTSPIRALFACKRKAATLLHVKPPAYVVAIEENEDSAEPYTVKLLRIANETAETARAESVSVARDLDQVWELVEDCLAFHPNILILKDERSNDPELQREWVVYDPKTHKAKRTADGPVTEPFAR